MFQKSKMHLIPAAVVDAVSKLSSPSPIERDNAHVRVEAIRDYCEAALREAAENRNKRKSRK